jgi:hypothetical protein
MDARRNKTGDDMGAGLYDGRKESAVRGEGVGVGEVKTFRPQVKEMEVLRW